MMDEGLLPGYLLGYAVLLLPAMALMAVYAVGGAIWLGVEWVVKRARLAGHDGRPAGGPLLGRLPGELPRQGRRRRFGHSGRRRSRRR